MINGRTWTCAEKAEEQWSQAAEEGQRQAAED